MESLTSCGWVLAKVSSLVAAEESRGRSDGCGTLGELLVESGYSRHADGIFGGAEALWMMLEIGSGKLANGRRLGRVSHRGARSGAWAAIRRRAFARLALLTYLRAGNLDHAVSE